MLIIIEGPDLAGKSTLASQLTEHLVCEVRHYGPPQDHPLVEYERVLDDYEPCSGQHIVYDRLHLGELVYGPIKRGESRLTPEAYMHIELNLARLGALMLILDVPPMELLARYRKRGETFVTEAELLDIAGCYRMFTTTVPLSVRTEVNPPLAVIEIARRLEAQALLLNDFTTYVGVVAPHILLLGDTRGPSNPGHARAFVPYPNTSGAWLLNAVSDLVWMRSLGIANACEEDIGQLWTTLGEPLVVALGRNAQQRCKEAELPHGAVPHPQYMRRFHHQDHRAYRTAIAVAAHERREYIPWLT